MRRSWSKIGPGWTAVAASFYDKCIIALVQNFQLTRKTKLRLGVVGDSASVRRRQRVWSGIYGREAREILSKKLKY